MNNVFSVIIYEVVRMSQVNEILPVPAVNDVTLSPPTGDVLNVNPPPGFDIVNAFGYLKMTIPGPPSPPLAGVI